jgi:choline dehydrogenase-like flavoprotein
MMLDLQNLPHGCQLQADLCIVGAGIAGLVLADALSDSGLEVLVLESGGTRCEDASQSLVAAEMAGWHHYGSTDGRFRVLGGSSTRWGGQLLPLPPHDFAVRAHVPLSGWPLDADALASYLSHIETLMGVNQLPYDDRLRPHLGRSCPSLTCRELQLRFSKWAPFGRRNLGRSLGRRLAEHPRVRVVLHANVTRLMLRSEAADSSCNSSDRVEAVLAQSLLGHSCTVQARRVVICCGTIETVRLLLASGSPDRGGIGNDTDLLGRYFHDHLSVPVCRLEGTARRFGLRHLAPWYRGRTRHSAKLEASAGWQRSVGCLNSLAHLVMETPEGGSVAWARQWLQRRQQGPQSATAAGFPWRALPADGLDLLQLAYQRGLRRRRWSPRSAALLLYIDCEQAPNPASRIALSSQRNVLGEPLAQVTWRWGEPERHTIESFARLVDQQWQHWGLGCLPLAPEWPQAVRDTFHPMGGTRMGHTPQSGVVDAQLRLHGVTNLYVASCSVFPTGGSSNPTLTLMALCLRLAEHLRHSDPAIQQP